MRKAIIKFDPDVMNIGTVVNIIEGSEEGFSGLVMPLDCILWDCGDYPVAIDDRWEDGVFIRNDEPLEIPPSETDLIRMQMAENQLQTDLAIAELAEAMLGGIV